MANYLGFEPKETTPFYFISYNTEDKEAVTGYVSELDRLGLPLWYDHGIHTGDRWEQTIADHLIACEAVILFFSPGIFKKEDSYVRKEFNLAKRYEKPIFVVLLESVNDRDVPSKYAFWWDSVKDLQCVFVGEFATVGDCAAKIMADLGMRPTETPSAAPTPAPTPIPAPATETPMAMLRRRILESLPADSVLTLATLESKVGYPLSNPEAKMLLKDMVDKGELNNTDNYYWEKNYDLRGIAMESIVKQINDATDYVTRDSLTKSNPRASFFKLELGDMLTQLVKENRIAKLEEGYAPADYPQRLAAAERELLHRIEQMGGIIPTDDYHAMVFAGLFDGDGDDIRRAVHTRGDVIYCGETYRLATLDVTDQVREMIVRQIEETDGFVESHAIRARSAFGLSFDEISAHLAALVKEEKIAFTPAINAYSSPLLQGKWLLACGNVSSYVKSNPPRLYSVQELMDRMDLSTEPAKKALAFLASSSILEMSGNFFHPVGKRNEAVMQYLADTIQQRGKLIESDIVPILNGIGIRAADAHNAPALLRVVAEKYDLYLVKENKTCYSKAGYYAYLCGRQRDARTSSNLLRLQKKFEELGDYEESILRATQCGTKAAALAVDEQQHANAKKAREAAAAETRAKKEKKARKRAKLKRLVFPRSIFPPLILWALMKFLIPRLILVHFPLPLAVLVVYNIVKIAFLVQFIITCIRKILMPKPKK